MHLPPYDPPNAQRAAMAAGLAPLLVLVVFTLLVAHAITPAMAFAAFGTSTLWVIYELSLFQRSIDSYNADYARRHLVWRTTETLRALVEDDRTPDLTRAFVQRFLNAGRVVLKDGQQA